MSKLIEFVPNFSDGRRPEVIDAIVGAMLGVPGTALLDKEMDADHNRSVISMVCTPEAAVECGVRGIAKAAELIDLNGHEGEHPRMGATDVAPFIPLGSATMEECADLARQLGERVGKELEIPVFLYGAASEKRKSVSKVRKGQFEGLKETLGKEEDHVPDFGPNRIHPTAGAIGIGARFFLIAYNVNLKSKDLKLARAIGKKIRSTGGGLLKSVQAMGFELKEKGCVQVSMNLTDYRVTGMADAYRAVEKEAAEAGVEVMESEIIGLVPQEALDAAGVGLLQATEFVPDQIVEARVKKTTLGQGKTLDGFLDEVGSKAPTPGGGTVSALTGALGAALVQMVGELTRGSKKYAEVAEEFGVVACEAAGLRNDLVKLMDDDAIAFDEVMAAFKLPKDDPERKAKIQEATIGAAEAPLETARKCLEVMKKALVAAERGNRNALSDAGTAAALGRAGIRGAAYNVRINVGSIKDEATAKRLEDAIAAVEREAVELDGKIDALVRAS